MNDTVSSMKSNTVNSLTIHSPTIAPILSEKDKIEFNKKIEDLIINIERKYENFELNNWKSCNDLNGKTEKEIFIYLNEKYDKNHIGNKKCLKLMDNSQEIKEDFSKQGYPSDSLSDLFNSIKNLTIIGKNDCLDVLKTIFSNYMDYVRGLREILSSIGQYTKAGSKDGTISVNFCDFKKALGKFKKEYNEKFKDTKFFYIEMLFKSKNTDNYIREVDKHNIYYKNKEKVNITINVMDKLLKEIKGIKIEKSEENMKFSFTGSIEFEEFDKFLYIIGERESKEKELTEDELQQKRTNYIKDLKNDLFYKMSFGMTKKILDQSFEAQADEKMTVWRKENDEKKWSNILQTEFDLFKKSLDALEKKMNTNLDELSKKYSSANSNYDNFVKIVSNTMNTLLEMAKGFLRF
ncbi:IpaD/SipD/SspD family type III secretion system needle tip protein [Proteus terrae]|uniref:IpaD/SipD/SspD family type III secretion system needle tip protein n=1 Tax=Proteus terrae TaxID=1574161 RepID=UPI000D686B91|nr:IpaD/SipD/SspD family type III secretion system needle tip protein [Proteus terrae]